MHSSGCVRFIHGSARMLEKYPRANPDTCPTHLLYALCRLIPGFSRYKLRTHFHCDPDGCVLPLPVIGVCGQLLAASYACGAHNKTPTGTSNCDIKADDNAANCNFKWKRKKCVFPK